MHRWRVDVRFAPMDSWSCLMPATFGKARMHARCKGGVVSTGLGVTATDQGDAIRVPARSARTA
jgi:hypothetical protein